MNVHYWLPDSEERNHKLSDIPSPTDMALAIERVRELAKKLREKPAFVNYTAWACSEEIIKALDGEQQ